jgi:nucleoside-diphosphate-sugar epimerase
MTILVLGATGFIGPHLTAALERRDAEVVGASRGGRGPQGAAVDRRDVRALRDLVRERAVATVIDLLAFTQADTAPLLAGLDGEVDRWVMASSADVYRNYEGLHRRACPAPIDGLLAEDSPLRASLYPYRLEPRRPSDAADAWKDDYDKIPLEAALRARPSLNGTIVRLPMVFGPGDRQRRFRWAISPMVSGAATIEVDPAWLGFRTTYGYVEDVADAMAAAALHPAAKGGTFNLGRDGDADNRWWLDRLAERAGWSGEVREVCAPPDGPIAAVDLGYGLTLDTRAFRTRCSWTEPTLLAEALDRTVADERRR